MAKSKKQLKQAAKRAAASGSLTNKQVNQLQKAGVKNSVINNIKTSNAQGYSTNRAQTVYNNAQTKAATPTSSTINKQNSLGQNLRAASGVNGVLSNQELLKISKKNDKNPEKVLEKAVGKGMMIGSNVVNKYQKGAYTDPRTAFWRGLSPSLSLATGMDSPILNQIRSAGKQDKGSALFIGSKGSTATTLPRKMGLGNGAQPVPQTPGNNEQPVSDGTAATAADPIMPFVPEELPLEEEKLDPGPGMMSGGGMGAAGANKLGRAKSRLRKLGIYGRGTGLLNRGLQYGNSLNA